MLILIEFAGILKKQPSVMFFFKTLTTLNLITTFLKSQFLCSRLICAIIVYFKLYWLISSDLSHRNFTTSFLFEI